MHQDTAVSKLTIRVPKDVKDWLSAQTNRNASSHASEIVRAVRERMERESTKQKATQQ